MTRITSFFWLVAIAVAAGVLMSISYRVEAQQRQLTKLQNSIEVREDSIRVLRAEWSYLNQPQRLELLAQKYLKLQPLTVAQVKTTLPTRLAKAVTTSTQMASAAATPTLAPTLAGYSNQPE